MVHVTNYTSRPQKRNEKMLIEIEDGFTPDVSKFQCAFFQLIDFAKDHHSFLDTDAWLPGRLMDIAEDQGSPLTFQVLDPNCRRHQVLARSVTRPAPVRNASGKRRNMAFDTTSGPKRQKSADSASTTSANSGKHGKT